MPGRKGLLAPQNNFLDTIATRFDGTRKCSCNLYVGITINVSYLDTKMYRPNIYVYYMLSLFGVYHET